MDVEGLLVIFDDFVTKNTVFEHNTQLTVPISPNFYLIIKCGHKIDAYAHGGDIRAS